MARIRGTRFSDDIDGTNSNDVIEGLEGHDRLWGHGGDDLLIGGAGDDDLDGGSGADRMEGGTGDDLYVVDSAADQVVELADEGIDVVLTHRSSYTLGANVEDLVALSAADFHGIGNGLDNYLYGYDGDDILDGAAGNDVLLGERGDDTYFVDDSGDQVIEYAGEGYDLIFTSLAALTLAANVEDLIFDGVGTFTGTGNALGNYIEGGAGNDVLDGLAGNDVLNGGAGSDRMIGGSGHDVFIVDNAGDRAIEASATGGIDTVESSVNFLLGANVEDLVLTGTAVINGTGNALANILTGNSAANILNGDAGADLMRGRGGNDTYVVDNGGDVVVESSSADGIDRVNSSVSFTLGVNVEHLTLTGTAAINGTGNGLANSILGNGAANSLSGLSGNDSLSGAGGNDRLFGGLGNDRLEGGAGADDFFFDTALHGSTNVDTIVGFSVPDDTIRLSRSVFTAIAANGPLDPDAFHQGSAAADAEDRIVYNQANGKIFYDPDGSGASAQILFATVAAGTPLTSADFIAY